MPTTETFNEDDLRKSIAGVWGEHGAHVDVYDEIVRRARRQVDMERQVRKALDELTNGREPGCIDCAIDHLRDAIGTSVRDGGGRQNE